MEYSELARRAFEGVGKALRSRGKILRSEVIRKSPSHLLAGSPGPNMLIRAVPSGLTGSVRKWETEGLD